MKTIFNKTIALFLTFVFVSTLFPYGGFAQSRPEPVPGSVKGYDRSVFDYHFSKADRELNPERWLSEARRGIGLAINSWEIFSIDLFDSSFTQDEAKMKLQKWSEEELEFRFTQWLKNRFFGTEIENITGQLSASINDIHLRYTYHLDEDGNLLREETTGDPKIIRPGDEGRDFAEDLAKWYDESRKNINDLSGYFETSVLAVFPELLAYFTEDLHDSLLPLIGNAANIVFSALQREFENIIAREQRLFTGRRTGDIYSLRKKSELEEAGYIVSKLIDQATAVCDAGIAALQAKIEAASGGEGDLALMGAEWLEMYREQFERGLKIWEEAEERFFIRRVEWEQDSLNLFEQGEETWILAFNRLEEERQKWELQAKNLIESGEEIFKRAAKELEIAIASAKIEILNNLKLREQSGASKAMTLVDMYFTCVSAAYAAIENGNFFINYYDGNSSVNITDDNIYKWIENEKKTKKLNSDAIGWLDEIKKAADMYRSFSAKAMEMRDNLLNDYGNIFGDGALKDILGEKASTEDFVLDEYQIALIKAKVLVNYWKNRTDIANAVQEYATELGAGRMTEAESILQWEDAKAAYEKAVADYESEMGKLNDIGAEIQDKTNILNNYLIKVNEAGKILKRINNEYHIYIQINSPYGIKTIENELIEKYEELLAEYKLIFGKDGNGFYQKELELAAKIELIRKNEERQAVLEYLINGDDDFPSLNDLKNDWEQIILFDVDDDCDELTRKLQYAAKMEAYTALKIREMEINMLIAPDGGGSDYGSAEWYADAWGVDYFVIDLWKRLLDDYEKAFEKLIEKRVLIEKEALTSLVNEKESNQNYSNLLANFYLVNEFGVEDGIIALNILLERISRGENYVQGNDSNEKIIAWFVTGGSFFSISDIFISEELYDYNLAEGLYNAYVTLSEYSDFIEREQRDGFTDIIKQFFGSYGIETEETLPKIEDICFALYNYSVDNQRESDYVSDVVVFLKDFDKIFINMPTWLRDETNEWKICFINYFTTFIYSKSPTIYLTKELIDKEYASLQERYDAFYEMFETNISNDIKTIRYFHNLYGKITDDDSILTYKRIILLEFESTGEYFGGPTGEEWWNYLDKYDLPDVEVMKEGVEGELIEPKAWASLADFRINYALKTAAEDFQDIEKENIKQLKKDYITEFEKNEKLLQNLQKLKIDFAMAVQNYEYALIPRGTLEEELLRFQTEQDSLGIIYQERMDEYLAASSDLVETAELYDLQYSKTKTAYGNIEDTKHEYEKQDAIRRWASTAYLDTDINDTVYCSDKLQKANVVLDILSDLYSDSDEIRPYQNAEYERLYTEYKKSIQEKLIADKAFNSLNDYYIQTISNCENKYNSLMNAVNELGKPFLYPDDYILPQSKKNWKIQDIIKLENGKLSFNRNGQFAIEGIDYDKINEINKYFDVGNIKDGQYHETTAFQEEVGSLGIRMAGYFQDGNKMTQWGLARDYLIRQLAASNYNITFLTDIKIKSIQLGANSSPGYLDYQKGMLTKTSVKISDFIQDHQYAFYYWQETAWNNLSLQEKADLEFYIILTLTNNNTYNSGFESFTALSELQLAYNEIKNYYDVAERNDKWYSFGLYKKMFEVNKLAINRVIVAFYTENKNLLKWQNGISANVSNIKQYYDEYNKSCESIAALQEEIFGEDGVSWVDIAEILKGLNTLNEEELALLKTSWDKIEEKEKVQYKSIINGLVGLVNWISKKGEEDKKALEEKWEKDNKERMTQENTYYEKMESFLGGKTDENDLREAMEAAYGNTASAWKTHFNNMSQAILDTLGEYHLYGPNYKEGFSLLAEEYSELVGSTFGIGLIMELAAREAEWNQQLIDIAEKSKTWNETAELMLIKGREEWNSSKEKMWESYRRWNENFMAEYDSVSILWNEAYLAGLEDKEKWLERAAEAADNASTGAMISAIGGDAEMFSRKMDTRDVIGMSMPNATVESENVLANLLSSSGISGMADAFSSINNLGNLSNSTIRRGINRTGNWDNTNARIEATALAQEANKAIADGESRKLAAKAKKATEVAIEMLTENVKSANENFNSSMDDLFMLQGQWIKSNGKYIKDIVAGSTLFEPVLYDRQEVIGYVDYKIGPISLKTRMDDAFLEGLESFAIQALIYKVQEEVSVIAEGIFGNGEKIKVDNERSYSSGKFGKHIGYEPSVYDSNAETRSKMFYDWGGGELGRLLTEYIFFQALDTRGLAEIALAPWDKRIWDDRGSFFESPSLRSMTDLVLQVGVAVISIAATVVTAGAGGPGAIVGAAALIAGINSTDDLVFATLDTAFGYKDWREAGFEFGKASLQNVTSAAVSAVFSGVAGVTGGFFKGGINGIIAKTTDTLGRVAGQTMMAGFQTITSGLVSSAINGITYDKDIGLGFDPNIFNKGIEGTMKNALVSMGSALVTNSLQAINSGMDMGKLVGFKNENQIKGMQILNNTLGSLAGQGINYALGGDFTLNVLNTAIFDLMGLKDTTTGNSGLLELHIGRDGTKMNFGTGGADLSPSSIIYSVMGAMVWDVNNRIDKYTKKSGFDAKVTLRAQYGFGKEEQKDQLWSILNGKAELRVGTGKGAETEDVGGKRVITLNEYRPGMSSEEQMWLAIQLGHEAYRDINSSETYFETQTAVWGHTEMAIRMLQDGQNIAMSQTLTNDINAYMINMNASGFFNQYVDDHYDTSGKYWKLTSDGRLINDNNGWLTREDGSFVLNADGQKIGANGIETGLLNIIFGGTSGIRYNNYSEEQIRFVQNLMIGSGMNYTEGKDGTIQSRTWGGNAIGQQLDMEQIMRSAGNTVAEPVFARYYEGTIYAYMFGNNMGNNFIPSLPTMVDHNAFSRFYNELLPTVADFYESQRHFFDNPEEYRTTAKHDARDPNYKYTNYENDAHSGTDIANGKSGGSIFAGISGMVRYAGYGNDPGNYVVMEYGYMFGGSFIGSGVYGEYMHMENNPNVTLNSYLNSNQILGTLGNTGRSSGAHLHYAIYTLQNDSAPQYNAFSGITLQMLLNNNIAQTVKSREAKYYVGTHSYSAKKVTYDIENYLNNLNRR